METENKIKRLTLRPIPNAWELYAGEEKMVTKEDKYTILMLTEGMSLAFESLGYTVFITVTDPYATRMASK